MRNKYGSWLWHKCPKRPRVSLLPERQHGVLETFAQNYCEVASEVQDHRLSLSETVRVINVRLLVQSLWTPRRTGTHWPLRELSGTQFQVSSKAWAACLEVLARPRAGGEMVPLWSCGLEPAATEPGTALEPAGTWRPFG